MQKKSFGAPQKPRISRLLKLIILIILIELNIICSLFLIRDIIWTSRAEVSPFKFLKYFLDFHAPIYTISLVYTASQTKSPWKKLLSALDFQLPAKTKNLVPKLNSSHVDLAVLLSASA